MSSLEELKKRLYQKGASFRARQRAPQLSSERLSASPMWRESDKPFMKNKSSRKIFWIFIALAAALALVFIGAGVYLVFGPAGLISSKAIEFDIQGPERINGGDRASWRVNVTNNEKTALADADLIVEYPSTSEPISVTLKQGSLKERRSLGQIAAGGNAGADFSAFVFGEENTDKFLKVTLEYRMEGSSAIFAKEKEKIVRINQSAVGLALSLPQEAKAGQEVLLKIQYVLNSPGALENLVLQAEYPDGFEFKSASPKSGGANNEWPIARLSPDSHGEITVRGVLNGEDLEKKIFTASVGRRSDNSFDVYGKGEAMTTLRRPFLDISGIRANGADNPFVQAGGLVNVEVFWKNNLPVSVKNMILEAKLSGVAFNPGSIYVDGGSYRGSDGTIVWNASSYPRFSFTEPGDEGSVRFRFNIANPLPISRTADTRFVVSVSSRIYAGETPEGFSGVDIESSFSRDMKISSEVQLARRLLYYSGPFANHGPLPPKVGAETTYTVIWSVTNSANDVKNAALSASLPAYVSWKNITSPSSENITYDSSSGSIVWNVGDLKAGTGIVSPAREVAFQVGFIPALNQVSSSPLIVSESVLEADDTFTGVKLRSQRPGLTTELYDDPQAPLGRGSVVK